MRSAGLDVVAVHEAGHLLAGWTLGFEIRGSHTVQTSRQHGITHLGPAEDEHDKPLDVATMLLCGDMAEKMLWREAPRFNWLAESHDARYARTMADFASDPFKARTLVELRAKSLLFTRWRAVEAIAGELTRKRYIFGDVVDQLSRASGARKVGESRLRPVDPDSIWVEQAGKRMTMRQWANVVSLHHHNPERARKSLQAGDPRRKGKV